MISLEKLYVLTPLQKMPKNLGDLSKFIVAKGYKKLPKVQKIAQSGHTVYGTISLKNGAKAGAGIFNCLFFLLRMLVRDSDHNHGNQATGFILKNSPSPASFLLFSVYLKISIQFDNNSVCKINPMPEFEPTSHRQRVSIR